MTTISDVITSAAEYADQEDSDYVPPALRLKWAQEAYKSLYLKMATLFVEFFVGDPVVVTVASGQSSTDLPADFLMLRGLERVDGTRRQTIKRFNFGNRFADDAKKKYRIVGNKLYVGVDGSGSGDYSLWYVKQPVIKALSDSIDPEMEPYREWLAYEVAIKMMIREETSPMGVKALQQAIEADIREAAINRDISGQDKIIDVRGGNPNSLDDEDWMRR